MKKRMMILGAIVAVLAVMVVFEKPILIGIMDVVDCVGMILNIPTIDVIDFLNEVYYMDTLIDLGKNIHIDFANAILCGMVDGNYYFEITGIKFYIVIYVINVVIVTIGTFVIDFLKINIQKSIDK